MTSPRHAAVLGGNRIPFARANGPYATESNQAMLTAAIDGLVARFSLQGEEIDEVVAGAVLKHARDFNLTREAVLGSQLASTSPAYDIQQACDTGLEAAVLVANKIALGQIDVGIAGGTDTASDAPVGLNEDLRKVLMEARRAKSAGQRAKLIGKLRPGQIVPDIPRNAEPRTGLSMGEHAAITAKEWGVTREDQDELAAASHQRLAAAYERGFFDDLVTPYAGLERDQNLRPDSSRREAREAQAGVRRGRGRDDDRRQLDPAHRRRRGRAAGQRRVGGRAQPARARAHHARADRGGRLRQRRRGPADGARARRAEAAREGRPDAAGLRLLRDPRGVRLAGARHAGRLGEERAWARSTAPSSTSTAPRSPPGTRSPPPAGGSSPRSRSCSTRRAPAAG